MEDAELETALATPVGAAALAALARYLNWAVPRALAARGATAAAADAADADADADAATALDAEEAAAAAAWVERELVAPLLQASELRWLCELCEGAAYLGVNAVQRACVAALARTVEDCDGLPGDGLRHRPRE